MAKKKCPSCNSAFNGRRCSECGYEVFDEIEVHSHAHAEYGRQDPWDQAPAPNRTIEVRIGGEKGSTYRWAPAGKSRRAPFTLIEIIGWLIAIHVLISVLIVMCALIGEFLG